MKKIFLLIILFIYSSSFAQHLDDNEKLISYCKVWGFLKYYHPEIASGKRSCELDFSKIFEQVRKANTKEELSKVYINWIEGLGKIKEIKKTSNAESFEKNFDTSWHGDKRIFTDELSEKLKHIENNRYKGSPYYVSQASTGYLSFTNEVDVSELTLNNEDAKYLSLFRYWNMVEYFYPYKYLIDNKWDLVLLNAIKDYSKVEDENNYNLSVKKLVANLDDSHVFVTVGKEVRRRVPFKVKNIGDKAVVFYKDNDSLCNLLDIKLGDIILEVEGIPLEEKFKEMEIYISASNLKGKSIFTYANILRGNGTDSLKITIERNNKIEYRKISSYTNKEIFIPSVENRRPWSIIRDKIGYVNMGKLKVNQVAEMLEEIFHTESLIFDLRNYPDFHFYLFSKLFNSRKVFSFSTFPDLKYPGKFTKTENKMGVENKNYYKGKIVVLVNEMSISRSEYMAMVFQAYENVTVIGSQTAGANGDVVNLNFAEGFASGFSGSGVYYPNGEIMQRTGVKLDIEVDETIEDLLSGKDKILERAIEYLKSN